MEEEVGKRRPLSSCQETMEAISASQVVFFLLSEHVATAESSSVPSLSVLLMLVTGTLSHNIPFSPFSGTFILIFLFLGFFGMKVYKRIGGFWCLFV